MASRPRSSPTPTRPSSLSERSRRVTSWSRWTRRRRSRLRPTCVWSSCWWGRVFHRSLGAPRRSPKASESRSGCRRTPTGTNGSATTAEAAGSAAVIATPDQIGSKVPALVNANMGYAVGTTDAGQPLYQDGSFILKADGSINREAFRDFSYRAMVEQAAQDESARQAVLRQGAEVRLLRRALARRAAGTQDRATLSGAVRRLHDRCSGHRSGKVRPGEALCPGRLEDRLGLHGSRCRPSEGIRHEGKCRECARGCCLRQGASRVSARSVRVRLRPGEGCRGSVCRLDGRRRDRQQCRHGRVRDVPRRRW